MTKGSTDAEKRKWEAMRTTPRGRGLVKSVVVDQRPISFPRTANPARANSWL